MPKSNRGALLRRGSGTVTVIEEPVRRSSVRNAKITFWVLWIIVTPLAAVVLASRWHPILALLAGLLIGLIVALLVAAVVLAWPVLRVLWWWTPEIGAGSGLVTGWVWLAGHTSLTGRLVSVALIVGVPAAIGPVRRRITAAWWCQVTRHRVRTCFAEFIITNRTGSLPFILWAKPTPAGERVWLWLRPGLALADIQACTGKIAVACWADTVIAEAASATNAAFVRLDVKRRDVLTAKIPSPLLSILTPGTSPRQNGEATGEVPTALDLPDVTAEEITPAKPAPVRDAKKTPAVASPPAPASTSSDDISDWI